MGEKHVCVKSVKKSDQSHLRTTPALDPVARPKHEAPFSALYYFTPLENYLQAEQKLAEVWEGLTEEETLSFC